MTGNSKKFAVKNGLLTQNTEYLSPDRSNRIDLEMLDSDTLSWEGDSGQLFSITDSLTGTIFSVNDISGIPSIEVDDDGTIRFAEFAGNVLVGTAVDNGTDKLQVSGDATVSGKLTVGDSENEFDSPFHIDYDLTESSNEIKIGKRLERSNEPKQQVHIVGNVLIDGNGLESNQPESDLIFHVENGSKNGISWKCTEYGNDEYGGYTGETAAIRATGGSPYAKQGLAFFTDDGSGFSGGLFHVTAERMRIETDTGNVLIGKTDDDASNKLQVSGDATVSGHYRSDVKYPAVRPTLNLDFANTKILDPRIEFSRPSKATYYDGETFAKAEENLATYSEDFTEWTTFNIANVVADDAAAPDGSQTADKVVPDTGDDDGFVRFSGSAPTISTVSVYAKSAELDKLTITRTYFNGIFVQFDLTAGTVHATFGNVTADIKDAGNGWYRCIVYYVTSDQYNIIVLAPLTDFSSDGRPTENTFNGTDGLYLWGAQLEYRTTVTDYISTTDQPITNYIPVLQTAAFNEPRFDHDPATGESKGLLIEEQRTNLLTYSQDFSNWGNTSSGTVVTVVESNSVVAPDGDQTADKVIANTEDDFHVISESLTFTGGTPYTTSVHAKAAEYPKLFISDLYGGAASCGYDLVSGVPDTPSSSSGRSTDLSAEMIDVGNGWYRCILNFTPSSTRRIDVSIGGYPGGSVGSFGAKFIGDDYSGIYLWGAQTEEGSFPTSYIKTEGSQVTRVADSASITTSNTIGTLLQQDSDSVWTSSETSTLDNTITVPSSKRILQYPQTLSQTEISAVTGD